MYDRGEDWVQESECSEEDPDTIDRQRASEVGHDDSSASARNPEHFYKSQQVIAEQYDGCAFASDIRTRTHGDPHVRFHEGRRIVYTIAYHCDNFAGRSKVAHAGDFLIRQQFRINFVHSQFCGSRFCDLLAITGKEEGSYTKVSQFRHRCGCFGPKHIGDPDRSQNPSTGGHEDFREPLRSIAVRWR